MSRATGRACDRRPRVSLATLTALFPPLALNGEAVAERGANGTAIAVISVISIVVGYLLLFALWRYVFSPKARAAHRRPADPRALGAGAPRRRPGAGPADGHSAAQRDGAEDRGRPG
jgi:hypothetical protein